MKKLTHDELVATLRRQCIEMDCGNCNTCVKNQAADAIENLSVVVRAQKAVLDKFPKWIPVTERLPGREWVLCKCRVKIHEVLSLRDGYWYHDPQHQYMSGFVTHWMPLPEPPKEDKP